MCQAESAVVLRSAGDVGQAVQVALRAVALSRSTGDQITLIHVLTCLGAALIGAGNSVEARNVLSEAIRQVLPTRHVAFLLNTFYYCAELLVLESRAADPLRPPGRLAGAVTLLSCVRTQTATWQIYKEKAAQLQMEIAEALPADVRATAIAHGQSCTLAELATTLLMVG